VYHVVEIGSVKQPKDQACSFCMGGWVWWFPVPVSRYVDNCLRQCLLCSTSHIGDGKWTWQPQYIKMQTGVSNCRGCSNA